MVATRPTFCAANALFKPAATEARVSPACTVYAAITPATRARMVVPTAGSPTLCDAACVAARVMFTAYEPPRVLLVAATNDIEPEVELDDWANRFATPLGSAAYA